MAVSVRFTGLGGLEELLVVGIQLGSPSVIAFNGRGGFMQQLGAQTLPGFEPTY